MPKAAYQVARVTRHRGVVRMVRPAVVLPPPPYLEVPTHPPTPRVPLPVQPVSSVNRTEIGMPPPAVQAARLYVPLRPKTGTLLGQAAQRAEEVWLPPLTQTLRQNS